MSVPEFTRKGTLALNSIINPHTTKDFSASKKLSQIEEESALYKKQESQSHSRSKQPQKIIQKDFEMTNNNNRDVIKLYDENIILKKKQEQLQKKINDMKKMLDQNQKPDHQNDIMEIVKLRRENKQLQQKVNSIKYDKNKIEGGLRKDVKKAINNHDKQKIEDLIKIIDNYKRQVEGSQNQIKTLQRQNYMLKQQVTVKDQAKEQDFKAYQQQFRKQEKAAIKLRDVNRDYELAKQQIGFLEAEINKLQTQLSTKSILEDQIQHLKIQNRKLQQNIRRLSESPLFQNFKEKVDEQGRIKSLQERCRMLQEKYKKQHEKNIGLETQLKLVQKQNIETVFETQKFQKENIQLRSKIKTNPIVDIISQDNQTLEKVIGYLQTENYKSQIFGNLKGKTSTIGADKKKFQKLIEEKQVLAMQLQRIQSMMSALQETYQQRQKVYQIQKKEKSGQIDQLTKKINEYQVQMGHKTKSQVVKDGIRYEEQVSMFSSDDTATFDGAHNYFDIYLGNIVLVQSLVKLQTNMQDARKLISFTTVDFYNHDTSNSKVGTGVNYNINSQFSFRVTEDQNFFNYLERGFLSIQVWASEGTKAINLGLCKIGLKPLIIKSKANVAPVINSSIPIYLNSKAMGTLNFVMRMRFPIYQQIKNFKLSGKIIQSIEQGQKRKIVMHIQDGKGFKPSANSFVYYSIQMNDYYTNTYSGSNPTWDHWNIIQILFNADFKNYIQKNQLQLTIMDDNAPLNDNQLSDILGTAKISLIPLLDNKVISITVPVRKENKMTGQITLKIFWQQKQNMDLMNMSKKQPARINFNKDITDRLKNYFKTKRLTPRQAFQKFDDNGTGLISKMQLEYGLLSLLSIRLDKKELQNYFNSLQQPLNELNFTNIYFDNPKTTPSIRNIKSEYNSSSNRENYDSVPISEEIREINKLVSKNTIQIKKISLQSFLRGKNILQLALQIDQNADGTISKAQLEKYLHSHGVEAYIEQQEVGIVEFLKKHSPMQTNSVSNTRIREKTETSIKASENKSQYNPRRKK